MKPYIIWTTKSHNFQLDKSRYKEKNKLPTSRKRRYHDSYEIKSQLENIMKYFIPINMALRLTD